MVRRPPGAEADSAASNGGPGITLSDKPVLDYNSYPHIVDRIASFLPFRSLVVWRGTCRRYRDRLDITTLRTSFRPLESDDECMVQLRTGGDYLVTEFSCQIPFHDLMIPLEEEDHFKFRDPELQALFAASIFRNLHVRGCCPHIPRYREGWEPYWWTGGSSPSYLAFGLLSEGSRLPDFSYIGRGEKREHPSYLGRRIILSPDSDGVLQFTDARGNATCFLDNWKADSDPKNWVDRSPRTAESNPTRGAASVWAFPVSGTEGNVPLFKSPVPYSCNVLYDFTGWHRSAGTEHGPERLNSLLEHARKHLLGGQNIILCGLEVIDSSWLDPTYPGDAAFIDTAGWPSFVTYLRKLHAGDKAVVNLTPWPAFPAYMWRRIAAAVPECKNVHSRIWVLPADAASKSHYGMYDGGWGSFGTVRLRPNAVKKIWQYEHVSTS